MDYQAQLEQAKQRAKRYGEQAQFQAPQAQMVGGRYVAPHALQYLAAALRAGGGMAGEQMANQEATQVESQRKQAIADALRKFGQQAKGTPENAPVDGMGPVIPAQAPDMMGAYQGLLDAPDQKLQDMALQGMAKIPEAQATRDARADEMRQRGEQRIQELQIAHQNRMDQMAASNANIEQMKQAQMDFQREMVKLRASMSNAGGGSQPYFQPVQTAQGVMSFNARTGRMEPITGADGRAFIGAAADPSLQGQIAGAKASASTEGKLRAEARVDAPKVVQQGEQAIKLVDDLLVAPGFKQAVGASRMLGVQKIPGTAAKDFDIRLDQLKGQQFLQAFEVLKGGGQITEVEGKKATDAISRMNAAGSEAEFKNAAREFQGVIKVGIDRAKKSGAPQELAAPKPRIRFDRQGNQIP